MTDRLGGETVDKVPGKDPGIPDEEKVMIRTISKVGERATLARPELEPLRPKPLSGERKQWLAAKERATKEERRRVRATSLVPRTSAPRVRLLGR